MQCANCGDEVGIPGGDRRRWDIADMEREVRNNRWGGITCDNCPAIMKVSYQDSTRFIQLFVLLIVLIPVISYVMYAANLQVFISAPFLMIYSVCCVFLATLAYEKRKLVITGMRPACRYCGAILETENAKFCPICGATLTSQVERAPQEEVRRIEIPTSQRVGTCMVCNLGLKASDLIAWCPHCGNAAHREHLLEWVHVKNQCPSCSEHLDEREVNLKTSSKSKISRRKKAPWKTV